MCILFGVEHTQKLEDCKSSQISKLSVYDDVCVTSRNHCIFDTLFTKRYFEGAEMLSEIR